MILAEISWYDLERFSGRDVVEYLFFLFVSKWARDNFQNTKLSISRHVASVAGPLTGVKDRAPFPYWAAAQIPWVVLRPHVWPSGIPPPLASLSDSVAGSPDPLAGLTDPLTGLPDPLSGLPDPLSGLPDPLDGLPDPLDGLPDPLH